MHLASACIRNPVAWLDASSTPDLPQTTFPAAYICHLQAKSVRSPRKSDLYLYIAAESS